MEYNLSGLTVLQKIERYIEKEAEENGIVLANKGVKTITNPYSFLKDICIDPDIVCINCKSKLSFSTSIDEDHHIRGYRYYFQIDCDFCGYAFGKNLLVSSDQIGEPYFREFFLGHAFNFIREIKDIAGGKKEFTEQFETKIH